MNTHPAREYTTIILATGESSDLRTMVTMTQVSWGRFSLLHMAGPTSDLIFYHIMCLLLGCLLNATPSILLWILFQVLYSFTYVILIYIHLKARLQETWGLQLVSCVRTEFREHWYHCVLCYATPNGWNPVFFVIPYTLTIRVSLCVPIHCTSFWYLSIYCLCNILIYEHHTQLKKKMKKSFLILKSTSNSFLTRETEVPELDIGCIIITHINLKILNIMIQLYTSFHYRT